MTDTSGFRRMPFRPSLRGITLKRWRLQNFKSVRDAEAELRPLTVVVGANSAGKSTLLQSIRAASQAIGASDAHYPLNGRGVRLGTVNDVKFRGPLSHDEQIEIAVQVDEQVPLANGKAPTEQEERLRQELSEALREQIRGEHQLVLGADFEFRSPAAADRLARSNTSKSALVATLSWDVNLGPSSQQLGVARIERLDVRLNPVEQSVGRDDRIVPSWLLAFATDDTEEASELEGDDLAPSFSSFTGQFSGGSPGLLDIVDIRVAGGFPLQASVMRPRAEVIFEMWLSLVLRTSMNYREDTQQQLIPAGDPVEALTEYLAGIDAGIRVEDIDYVRSVRMELSPRSALHLGIDLNTAAEATFREGVIERLALLGVEGHVPSPTDLGDLGPASAAASAFLGGGIRYLGPLRDEPRAAYPDSPEGDDSYVGSKGEFTASVLQRHGRRKVSVPMPEDDGVSKTPRRPIQLTTAVNRWAKYLDIGESFSVSDQGRFGIQMQVRQAGVDGDLDLTSVGTGVSQLLPVIVMCVQAAPGSLLLIEQPELHLNPKVQQRLADFLLAMAQSGRNLIVETHSEYLISRLRRRVAEDEMDSLQETIGIYFAKRVNGATTYDLLQSNEYGNIEEWPEDFFDQATEEEHAILSAAVRKRRAKAAKAE